MTDWKNRIVGEGQEPADQLLANPNNWRLHGDEQTAALTGMLAEVGWVQRVVVNQRSGHLIDGHLRVKIAMRNGDTTVPVLYVDLSDDEERKVLAALDPLGSLAATDQTALDALLDGLQADDSDFQAFLDTLRGDTETGPEDSAKAARERLADLFLAPPFTLLDGRAGYWQERKRDWLALGLQSEVGRDDDLLYSPSAQPPAVFDKKQELEARDGRTYTWREFADRYPEEIRLPGTSVFDPVLCEIAYKWFAPRGGSVLDPFAGGSVRGIVAAMLGYDYQGIDLREEQIIANRDQWAQIGATGGLRPVADPDDYTPDLTPVERRGAYWFKRDDQFTIAGVRGGKARTCWALAQGAAGLVTAGSRSSPQANIVAHIVAHIAARLGIPCHIHTPSGEPSQEIRDAQRMGAELFQHRPGYNSVIVARAHDDAQAAGYTEIPFGMDCQTAVDQTRRQAANIPPEAKRILVPVGSGMTLAGILWGLKDAGRDDVRVLAVQVGADPTERLNRWAPSDWRLTAKFVPAGSDYHTPATGREIEGIALDPHYEAKCLAHLRPGDVFWLVGYRASADRTQAAHTIPEWHTGDSRDLDTILPESYRADLVFSCPPYADLEVYSDDPADISAMDWPGFRAAYREIIRAACARLRDNRFAVWVVSEIRGPDGAYRGLVPETIRAFEDAGLRFYNEATFVTPTGSLPMRAGPAFRASRKLGRAHQNVLVFRKGDEPDAVSIEALAESLAAAFERDRQLIDPNSKVLVFIKGSGKAAAAEYGAPPIADDLSERLEGEQ